LGRPVKARNRPGGKNSCFILRQEESGFFQGKMFFKSGKQTRGIFKAGFQAVNIPQEVFYIFFRVGEGAFFKGFFSFFFSSSEDAPVSNS
jgi:hypothetical protein